MAFLKVYHSIIQGCEIEKKSEIPMCFYLMYFYCSKFLWLSQDFNNVPVMTIFVGCHRFLYVLAYLFIRHLLQDHFISQRISSKSLGLFQILSLITTLADSKGRELASTKLVLILHLAFQVILHNNFPE
jgi:hypothetical protein